MIVTLVLAAASAAAMRYLGVFSLQRLSLSPPRQSSLSLMHVVAAFILYMGIAIFAFIVSGYHPAAPGHSPTIDEIMRMYSADTISRLAAAGFVLFLAAMYTVDGLQGWGLSMPHIPQGVRNGLLTFLLIVPILLLTSMATQFALNQFGVKPPLPHPILQLLQQHPPAPLVALLFMTASIVAPLSEEFFFRGLLQTALSQRDPSGLNQLLGSRKPYIPGFPLYPHSSTAITQTPPTPDASIPPSPARRWLAILATSTIFAAIHGEPAFFPVLFVLAVALGYIYERTGNLWSSITVHAAFNSTQLILTLYFAPTS